MSEPKLEFSRGEHIAGKYEVVDVLHDSALGATYRVKHLKTSKYVRLTVLSEKVASEANREQVEKAYEVARSVQHPHAAKVGELGQHEGLFFYTWEDFESSTLRELMAEYRVSGKQFEVKEACQITTQILEAAGEVHKAGSIVRALRPESVLINVRYTGPRRQTFVAQSKITGAGFWDLVPAAVLAEDEFSRGEAQYLAPELKSFEPKPTPRSDVFSAGVIFYELLVGTAPVGTFQLPRSKRPDLPEHINDVVELALAQAVEDRYHNPSDFAADIQRTFQDASLVDNTERKPLITPIGWAVALLIVVLITVIAYNMQPDPEAENAALDSQVRKQVIEAHPKPSPDEIKGILEKYPKNMAYVPGGPYVSGRLHSESMLAARPTEPLAEVVEVEPFLIDVFEFPNYPGEAPAYGVSYDEAQSKCEEAGKRLCTEAEWEKACKGPRNFVYSYGDTYDPEFCGEGLEEIYVSGNKKACRSGWGVHDISGNFREWTSTPAQGDDNRRIVKGGMKGHPHKGTRCALATDESMAFKDSSLSFRCCLTP